MEIQRSRIDEIEKLCNTFRIDLLKMLHSKQTGHPGGSLSAAEIITTLYSEKLKIDAGNPASPDRDRFVLGKGHAAPMLYLNLAERGFFPKEELINFRQINSILQGHPTLKTPGVDAVTGPLGLGISAASGMAMGLKLDGSDKYIYCLMGDGEIQEGIVWEAAMGASKYKLDNLICILDNNGVQLDGFTKDIMPMDNISARWESFGWRVIEIDGHCVKDISDAIDLAKTLKGQPILINAKTVKGKGVSFMEHQNTWHGKPISDENLHLALNELQGGK